MAKYERFEDLPVWQEAARLYNAVLNLLEEPGLPLTPGFRSRVIRSTIPRRLAPLAANFPASLPFAICHSHARRVAHRWLPGCPAKNGRAACVKQALRDKLIDHKNHIDNYGQDMPEIRIWRRGQPAVPQDKQARKWSRE